MRQLTAAQARVIAKAELAYRAGKVELERLDAERRKIRDRYRDLLPAGEQLLVGGVKLKRIVRRGGRIFLLSDYLASNKLTKAMEPFVKDRAGSEEWRVDVPPAPAASTSDASPSSPRRVAPGSKARRAVAGR